MAAAAVAAAIGIGATLVVPLFRALSGARQGQSAAARQRRIAAERLREEREKNSSLKKALALARKQEAQPVPTTKAKAEPELHTVKLEDKKKADTLGQLGAEKPSKKTSAERLYRYVSREIHEGRSSNLGSKGHPNAQVKQGQLEMGGLVADGIYGDKTRARGKELTGKPWPARRAATAAPVPAARPATPAPAVRPAAAAPAARPPEPARPILVSTTPAAARPATPVKRTPQKAAEDLLAFANALKAAKKMSQLGTKAAPSPTVKSAQADMGGLVADGIYGNKTRARGKELTGQEFPVRA